MEWLQDIESLLNDLAAMIQYSQIFAIAVGVAFLIMFSGLVIINLNLHEVQRELKELKSIVEREDTNG